MDIQEYLEIRGIKSKEKKNEIWFNCPFHKEDTPSCSINKNTEEWYCFGCHASGSDLVSFEFALNRTEIYNSVKEIEPSIVKEKNNLLLKNSNILSRLWNERRITEDVVRRFMIGWDGQRIWIPIMYQGKILNVKKWDAFKLNHVKMLWLRTKEEGYITNGVLFPYENLKASDLFFTEGEGDCLSSISAGIKNAITGGGTSFDFISHLFQLKGKRVTTCFDYDAPGGKASKEASERLTKAKIQNRNLHLKSIGGQEKDDLTELFLRDDSLFVGKVKDFLETEEFGEIDRIPNESVTLTDALAADYYRKTIKFSAFITAIDADGPKQIAKNIMIIKEDGTKNFVQIDAQAKPEVAVSLLYSGGFKEKETLKQLFSLEKKDTVVVLSTQTVLHLQMQQDYLQTNINESSNFMIDAFIEDYRVNPYKTYEFVAKVVRNPKNQNICFFILSSETKLKHDKKITEEDLEWLQHFWIKEGV